MNLKRISSIWPLFVFRWWAWDSIKNPVEVYVDEGEFGVDEIAIKCAHGHLHLVKFKHAVPLNK